MQPFSAQVVPHQTCLSYPLLGTDFKLLFQGNQSHSNLTIFHALIHPQSGAPTHYHQTFEELYYLLQGELQITVDAKSEKIQAGTLVYIPRNTAHSYFNATPTSVQLLMWACPSGIENFIADLSTALSQNGLLEIHSNPVLINEHLEAIAAQHDFIPVTYCAHHFHQSSIS